MEFKDVVKASAGTGAAAPAARATPDAIDKAAKVLSKATYPLMKDVDWNAVYYSKVPGAKAATILSAVKYALDQVALMGPTYVKEGALAHAKAISDVDGTGMLPLEDFCGDQLGVQPHDQVFGDERDNEHLQRLQGPPGLDNGAVCHHSAQQHLQLHLLPHHGLDELPRAAGDEC